MPRIMQSFMARIGLRKSFRLAMPAIIGACMIFALLPAGVASAATTDKMSYSKAWIWKSAPLSVCISFVASGYITYTVTRVITKGNPSYNWQNVELHKPQLVATVGYYAGGVCQYPTPPVLSQLRMAQYWTGYDCSFNPSLGASFPWGLSVGGWPSCGDRERAANETTFTGKSTVYRQSYSTNQASLGDGSSSSYTPGPCYGVYFTVDAWVNGDDEDGGASNSYSVCLVQ